MFITIEGIDGCGKTTQIQMLADWLAPYPIVVTREPGGSQLGKGIRDLLLTNTMSSTTELLLFAADRAAHIADVIRPALLGGGIVLCDRSFDSTVAYQGYGQGFGDLPRLEMIDRLNAIALDGLCPNLTIWLDVPVKTARQRVQARGRQSDRFDCLPDLFFERVRRGYEVQMERSGERIVRVDGDRVAEVVHQDLKAIVGARLSDFRSAYQDTSTASAQI